MRTTRSLADAYARMIEQHVGLRVDHEIVREDRHEMDLKDENGRTLGRLGLSGTPANHSISIEGDRHWRSHDRDLSVRMEGLSVPGGSLGTMAQTIGAWAIDVRRARTKAASRDVARRIVGDGAALTIRDMLHDRLRSLEEAPTADGVDKAWEVLHILETADHPSVDLSPVRNLVQDLARRVTEDLDAPAREPEAPGATIPASVEAGGRTDIQIVAQTEAIAAIVLKAMGTGYGTRPEYLFHQAEDSRGQAAWRRACSIQEILTKTDADDAVAGLDAEGDDLPERLAEALETMPEWQGGRSDEEIVEQTEAIAAVILDMNLLSLRDEGATIRDARDPRAENAWFFAKRIQSEITDTDVDDALSAIEDEPAAAAPAAATI